MCLSPSTCVCTYIGIMMRWYRYKISINSNYTVNPHAMQYRKPNDNAVSSLQKTAALINHIRCECISFPMEELMNYQFLT